MYKEANNRKPETEQKRPFNASRTYDSSLYFRHLEQKRYKVKVFPAGQNASPEGQPGPRETRQAMPYPEFETMQPVQSPENNLELAEDRLPVRPSVLCAGAHLQQVSNRAPRTGLEPGPQLQQPVYYEKPAKPKKHSWWYGLFFKFLVFFFVISVLSFLFRPAPSSAEDSPMLSMNLPKMLSRLLPQLNLFVQSTGDDMLQIGRTYTSGRVTSGQSSDPDKSLENMINGIKDINKEVGNTETDTGMWDQIQKVFKNTRQEAWQQAGAGNK